MHSENENKKKFKVKKNKSKIKMNNMKEEKGFLCREVMQVSPWGTD